MNNSYWPTHVTRDITIVVICFKRGGNFDKIYNRCQLLIGLGQKRRPGKRFRYLVRTLEKCINAPKKSTGLCILSFVNYNLKWNIYVITMMNETRQQHIIIWFKLRRILNVQYYRVRIWWDAIKFDCVVIFYEIGLCSSSNGIAWNYRISLDRYVGFKG